MEPGDGSGFDMNAKTRWAVVLAVRTAWVMASGPCLAQEAQVHFSNYALPEVDAPFSSTSGCRLAGPNWKAQLYYTLEDCSYWSPTYRPAGIPVTFLTGDFAGYFVGGVVTLPNVPRGARVCVQVRAWRGDCGSTWEEAFNNLNCPIGVSQPLTVQTDPSPIAFPAKLVGLQGGYVAGGLEGFRWQRQPDDLVAFEASSTEMIAWASGSAGHAWQKQDPDGSWTNLLGGPSWPLSFPRLATNDAGNYRLVISNECSMTLTSRVAVLTVLRRPLLMASAPELDGFRFLLMADGATNYPIEASSDLKTWELLTTVSNPVGPVLLVDTNWVSSGQRFYRVKIP